MNSRLKSFLEWSLLLLFFPLTFPLYGTRIIIKEMVEQHGPWARLHALWILPACCCAAVVMMLTGAVTFILSQSKD